LTQYKVVVAVVVVVVVAGGLSISNFFFCNTPVAANPVCSHPGRSGKLASIVPVLKLHLYGRKRKKFKGKKNRAPRMGGME
jgi:hypothetical protein